MSVSIKQDIVNLTLIYQLHFGKCNHELCPLAVRLTRTEPLSACRLIKFIKLMRLSFGLLGVNMQVVENDRK